MSELSQFVLDACRTEKQIDAVTLNPVVLSNVLTALISLGNILDMLKKNAFYGKPLDAEQLSSYGAEALAAITDFNGANLEDTETIPFNPRLFHSIVGVATESTELLEALKEGIDTQQFDHVNFIEELGDVNWYQAIALDTLDVEMETVLKTVISKLRERFPDKFTSDNAINRDLEAERNVLEEESGLGS